MAAKMKDLESTQESRLAALGVVSRWEIDAGSRRDSWLRHANTSHDHAIAWGAAGVAGLVAGVVGHWNRSRTFTRFGIDGGSASFFGALSGLFAFNVQRQTRERKARAEAHAAAWQVARGRLGLEHSRLSALGIGALQKKIDARVEVAHAIYFSVLSGPSGSP